MPHRSGWHVLLYYLLVTALAFGGTIAASVLAGRHPDPANAWLLKCMSILVLVAALTWFYLRRDGLRWRRYGIVAGVSTVRRSLLGLSGGMALALAWAAIVAFWTPFEWQSNPAMTVRALIMGSASTLAIGMAEEIGYRSYGMERLSITFGPLAAVLLPSLLFAAVHTSGGMPWTAALLVVGSCSALYGALMLLTRSLPLVAAFHIGNNLVQDALLRTSEGSLWMPVFRSVEGSASRGLAIWSSMAILNLLLAAWFWRRWRVEGSPGFEVTAQRDSGN